MARLTDVILVIDVESTCWKGAPPPGQVSEIIEVGLCPIDLKTLRRVEKRSILVCPEESTVSDFCRELTTLHPEMFVDSGNLDEAVGVLKKEYRSRDRLWASWGDYDRRQFERDCERKGIAYPFGPSHLNVKSMFASVFGLGREQGLDDACRYLNLPLEGTHHRGHDDAWNIAGVLCHLLKSARERRSQD